jgi:hypothetical protein
LHIEQAQFLATDHLGVRAGAVRARAFYAGSLEVVPAILAMVPNRKNLNYELRALGNRAAGSFSEDGLQTVGIENASAADFNVYTKYAADGSLIGRLV